MACIAVRRPPRGFQLGNLEVVLGDCILVRCNPHGTDGVEDFDVARLTSCYEIGKTRDNLRGRVQWYSRVRDIEGIENCPLPPGTAGNALQPDHEVLLEMRKFTTEIDLETIVALCHVEECAVDVLPSVRKRPESALPGRYYFVCRFGRCNCGSTTLPLERCHCNKGSVPGKCGRSGTGLAYCPIPGTKKRSHITALPNFPVPVHHSSIPYSPGKENIPPCSDVSRSNAGGKRRASPSPPRGGRGARPSKRPRAVLLPVPAALGRSPAAAGTRTPSAAGTPTAKKTPNRNLDLDFDTVEKTLTDAESAASICKSPKEKMKDLKMKGVSRKLDDKGINSVLEALGDSFDGGESDADGDDCADEMNTCKGQKIADGKTTPLRIQDIIKTRTFSSSSPCISNDNKKVEKSVTPKKTTGTKLSISVESRGTPKNKKVGRGRPPATPKTVSTPSSRRQSVAKGTPIKIVESSPVKGTPSRKLKPTATETPSGKGAADMLSTKGTKGTAGTPSTKGAANTPSRRTRGFPCPECDMSLRNRNELQEHLEDEHDVLQTSLENTPTPKKKKKTKAVVQKGGARTGRKPSSFPLSVASSKTRVSSPLNKLAASAGGDSSSSALQLARERLHVCAVPDSLPCREEECQQLFDFIESKLVDGTGGCMYISGVPGTGKTATVREVVRLLRDTQESGELPEFTFVEVNALKLSQPRQVWVEVWRALTGQQRTTADHAAQLLERRFRQPGPRAVPTLLLVDELDLLWTRKQDVLYNLFEWPNLPGSQLIVVAIANTMDLPERVMMARVASRLGLTRVTFHPYTHHQLQEIVSSRLSGIDGFDSDAVQLVARKVAAVSGDARRALDICRRATELAEADTHTSKAKTSPRKRPHLVGLKHVDLALKEMFTSPNIMAIRCCSDLEQQVLRAVLAEFQRTGLEETKLDKLYSQFLSLSAFDGSHKRVTLSCVVRAVNRLSGQRLLITDPSGRHLGQRITLNLSLLDVKFALDTTDATV